MRHSFSRRLGYEPTDKLLSLDQVTPAVLNGVWNVLFDNLSFQAQDRYNSAGPSNVVLMLARDHFRAQVDSLPTYWAEQRSWFRNALENEVKSNWFRLYDLIEQVASRWESLPTEQAYDQFQAALNVVFKDELVPYRLVDKKVVPITSEAEVKAITSAVEATARGRYDGAGAHLQAAIARLAERPEPDCRNAAKEAVGAVESLVVALSGSKKKGVADALKLLEHKGVKIHAAFAAACGSLYAYSSDEGGIRHPALEEEKVGFAEAKFMVIVCSAFVHLLIEKAQDAEAEGTLALSGMIPGTA